MTERVKLAIVGCGGYQHRHPARGHRRGGEARCRPVTIAEIESVALDDYQREIDEHLGLV